MKNSEAKPHAEIQNQPQSGLTNLLRRTRQFRLIFSVLILSFGCYLFISHFVLMAVEIKGISMSPTLIDGERLLLYRWTYLWRNPRPGEIVVITDPEDQGLSIKRVVGVPHDTVEMRREGLYINGSKVSEPYLPPQYTLLASNQPTKPVHLGDNSYFVLGDNRDRSADSRSYGPVRRNQILGTISKSK